MLFVNSPGLFVCGFWVRIKESVATRYGHTAVERSVLPSRKSTDYCKKEDESFPGSFAVSHHLPVGL